VLIQFNWFRTLYLANDIRIILTLLEPLDNKSMTFMWYPNTLAIC
jgi:hypothetical protein